MTSTPRPRWAAAASTSAASTAGIVFVPYDWCLRAAPRPRAVTAARARPSRRSLDTHGLRHARRQHPPVRPARPAARRHRAHHPPARAPGRRDRGRRPRPRPARDRRPALRVHRRSRRATATSCTSCPSGLLAPGRQLRAARRGRLERATAAAARWPHDPLPHRPRAAPRRRRSASGATRSPRSASAGWRCRCRRSCRASTRSASTPTTWLWARCEVSPPDANGEGSVLLWAVRAPSAAGAARLVADRARRLRVPAPGPLPRRLAAALPARSQPHVLVRRRAAAALRPAHAARRRPPCPRGQPDGRGVLPRGAGLRAGADCDRPLQQRSQSAGQRHVHHRALPRPREPAPAPACASPILELRRPQAGAPGEVAAVLAGTPLPAREPRRRLPAHRRRQRRVVSLDYRKATSLGIRGGTIAIVRLSIPAGTELPGAHEGVRDCRCLPACRARTVMHSPLHSAGPLFCPIEPRA